MFKDTPSPTLVAGECATIFSAPSSSTSSIRPRQVLNEVINPDIPWAYFDDGAAHGLYGAGMVIHKNMHCTYAASLGLGEGLIILQSFKF